MKGATAILFFIVMSFLWGVPIWFLWNWLIPEIFELPEVSYWQASGLYALCKLLFGD